MTYELEISPYLFTTNQTEEGLLQLALLKENFRFRRFWRENIDQVIERRAYVIQNRIIPEELPVSEDHPYFLVQEFLDELKGSFSINDMALRQLDFKQLTNLLDPYSDRINLRGKERQSILALLFFRPGITSIDYRPELPFYEGSFDVQPYRRGLIIDLRAKRSQLEKEFSAFLDRIEEWQKTLAEGYDQWEQNCTRFRKEAWKHLKVWKLRKQKWDFPNIALKLKITEDNARKKFYRAYELTQQTKYDQKAFSRESWAERDLEIKESCANCDIKATCKDFCPEMLERADRDHVARKEKLLSEDSDAMKDFLMTKI